MTFDINTPVALLQGRLTYLENNIERYSGLSHITQPMQVEADELRELIVIVNNTADPIVECLADRLSKTTQAIIDTTGICHADLLAEQTNNQVAGNGACHADNIKPR